MYKHILAVISLVSVLSPVTTWAFRLDPMVVDFQPTGTHAAKTIRVDNEAQEKIAVKIQMYRRIVDDKGIETREPTQDFKVFPTQFSLNSKDSRVIRVVYSGPKEIDREQSYRLVATQLPVDFKEETRQSGVKFLFEFVASVYVNQSKFFPQIEVESITAPANGQVQMTIANTGTRHRLLRGVSIKLQDTQGRHIVVDENLVKDWNGENLLSGGRRTYTFKSASQFDLKARPAQIEMKDAD
ncbi:fimbria/pilus periplasmic chaperone [Pseudobdellovibrio exovorus]|uniref:Pili assembly chaperone N-terminal domain-containing protein n=1 Tax=Pseudobdellovibrio exovorus JSS TaxID=1184267 RepID=M4VCH2_9BACT|nr:fimbria/pilus periplasmic chaperone [Pseudobdellovibrio exovorus]AGH96180.1 hypothetical protein A11Q_1964 [Pseudobdellovibrio exovorus JSS]